MSNSMKPSARSQRKAICLPSGDQVGKVSEWQGSVFFVTEKGFVPFAFMTKIWLSGTVASKAMYLPFGEYSKLSAAALSLISLRDEDGSFGATTKGSRAGS